MDGNKNERPTIGGIDKEKMEEAVESRTKVKKDEKDWEIVRCFFAI